MWDPSMVNVEVLWGRHLDRNVSNYTSVRIPTAGGLLEVGNRCKRAIIAPEQYYCRSGF